MSCLWQGNEATALWRARQVWCRAEEQPEEEAIRHPGPEVEQERHHFLVSEQSAESAGARWNTTSSYFSLLPDFNL